MANTANQPKEPAVASNGWIINQAMREMLLIIQEKQENAIEDRLSAARIIAELGVAAQGAPR